MFGLPIFWSMVQPLLWLVSSLISGGWASDKSENSANRRKNAKGNGAAIGVMNEGEWMSIFWSEAVVREV